MEIVYSAPKNFRTAKEADETKSVHRGARNQVDLYRNYGHFDCGRSNRLWLEGRRPIH